MKTKIILTLVLAVLLIALGVSIYTKGFSTNPLVEPQKATAVKKAVEFINSKLPSGKKIVLEKVALENGLYHIFSHIDNQKFEFYLSRDGSKIFTQYIPVSIEKNSAEKENKVTKTEKPEVLLFTMAFCPFGNQAENNIEPAIKLLSKFIKFQPHYVIYSHYGDPEKFCFSSKGEYCSMHGKGELHEDIRELCVFKYMPDKYWSYVLAINRNCSPANVDSCWEEWAKKEGIDTAKIQKCLQEEGESILKSEVALNKKYGINASPTLLINGYQYRGKRTPQAYKEAICQAFKNQPQICNQKLEDKEIGPSGSCK